MNLRSFNAGLLVLTVSAATVLGPSSSLAAIPNRSGQKTHSLSTPLSMQGDRRVAAPTLEATRAALKLPLDERIQALQGEGPTGYRNLVQIMFDEKNSMDARWRAVTAVGRIGGELSRPELVRAFHSRDWYMRNAALVSAAHTDRGLAVEWARKLLSDKSLVVRTAAVNTLSELNDTTSSRLLWEKLYAKENFRGKQSLFIRHHIVETLARMESQGNESKFVDVLADHDETLYAPAISALEKLTQQSFGSSKEPLKVKRAEWQRWWQEKSTRL